VIKKLVIASLVALFFVSPVAANQKVTLLHTAIERANLPMLPELINAPRFVIDEIYCLALNIYHEARGSTADDKKAVGLVTLNRLETGKWGKSICEVVWQNSVIKNKRVYQFSWTKLSVTRLLPKEDKTWLNIVGLAYSLYIQTNTVDHTNGAIYFYHKVKGSRPIKYTQSVTIGPHKYVK